MVLKGNLPEVTRSFDGITVYNGYISVVKSHVFFINLFIPEIIIIMKVAIMVARSCSAE